jgi:flagellar hook-associated protein 3 FlgL
VLAQAQTKHLGRPVFGGTVAGDAYDSTGTYLGDTGAVRVPITPTVTSQVTRTGPEVFGTHNPTDDTAGDVFQLLDHLANAVEAGDPVAMTAGVGLIDGAKSVVQRAQAELGSRLRQLEDLDAGAKIRKDELKTSISELEDVDIAEAYMEMAAREAAYQGAVAVAAKVIQPSLLDFLR